MEASSLERLSIELQECLQCAVQKICPDVLWLAPVPWLFGSRKYGLAGPTSDVDFLVVAPDAIADKSNDLRACLAGILRDAGVKRHALRDMKDLQTLKWTDSRRGVEVSLLLTSKPLSQLRVTIFLRDFDAIEEAYRLVVVNVITQLRRVDALNSHAPNASVGQSLKTASVALWCAGLKTSRP
jgi:predicted nucleotidyltransferase